jgi:hypothetical protein
LNTPESDIDERGIFVNTDPAFILGTKRFDEERDQNPNIKKDLVLKEVSHFFRLLRAANTEAIELLFAEEECFNMIAEEFIMIRSNAGELIDSVKLFNCLRGYIQGERRLALGERAGKIGGKRFEQVQKYGFSPKNFTQLFRLANMGIEFFNTGKIVVRLSGDFRNELLAIKTSPQLFTKEQLDAKCSEMEGMLIHSFENRKQSFEFNEPLANKLILSIYRPYLFD